MISIVTKEEFEEFEKRLLNQLSSLNSKKEYLTKKECFELYEIKERTLTKLRDKRMIKFSKIGNTCLYEYNSLMKYLENQSIKAIA